ncbi:MAG: GNAT family N-acetyltransferase [Solirubrobacterales bacterium]
MPFSIRQAATADVDVILSAYEWLFEAPGQCPETWDETAARQRLEKLVVEESATAFVAIRSLDATLAGFCTAYLDLDSVRYGPRCWVEDLAVAPDSRGRGIGNDLLDSAAAWARESGASHLELDTGTARTDSRRFYEARKPQAEGISYHWSLAT